MGLIAALITMSNKQIVKWAILFGIAVGMIHLVVLCCYAYDDGTVEVADDSGWSEPNASRMYGYVTSDVHRLDGRVDELEKWVDKLRWAQQCGRSLEEGCRAENPIEIEGQWSICDEITTIDPNVGWVIDMEDGLAEADINPSDIEVEINFGRVRLADESVRQLCESGRICEVMGHHNVEWFWDQVLASNPPQQQGKCRFCGATCYREWQ